MTLKNILLAGMAALTLASCGKSNLEQMAEIAQKVPELQLVKDFQRNYKGEDALKGELTPEKGYCISLVGDDCGRSSCTAWVDYYCTLKFSEGLTLQYDAYDSQDYEDGEPIPKFSELNLEQLFRETKANQQKLAITAYDCRLTEDNESENIPPKPVSNITIKCGGAFFKPKLDAC